jgi:DNA-binding NtrC family response regulator
MNIMLIDDDKDCLLGLSSAIEPAGYNCELFTAPEEAVTAYDAERHDVVITDMKMPGLTGIQVLKIIKARNPAAKVIIITGYGDVDTAIAAVNYGAYAFFGKPVNIAELVELLEKVDAEVVGRRREREDMEQMMQEYYKLKRAYEELHSLLKQR